MAKKPLLNFLKSLCVVLLIGGCTTLHKRYTVKECPSVTPSVGALTTQQTPAAAASNITPKITQDVSIFYDLQKADLNNDGREEIIALYKTSEGSRGVKVISMSEPAEGKVIFSKYFDSPDVQYKLRDGIPTIIVRGDGDVAGCGVNKSYCWDGSAFTQDKSNCKLSVVTEP